MHKKNKTGQKVHAKNPLHVMKNGFAMAMEPQPPMEHRSQENIDMPGRHPGNRQGGAMVTAKVALFSHAVLISTVIDNEDFVHCAGGRARTSHTGTRPANHAMQGRARIGRSTRRERS